jgi:hypothetical protein
MAVFSVVATIALMMEGVQTTETLGNSYRSTRRYNTEDSYLHIERRENLKSYFLAYTSKHIKYVA